MIRVFSSKNQKVGLLGEDLAVRYLENNNYSVVLRNFGTKYGEVDIIAKKEDILYFFEVKSSLVKEVSHETYNPAENMHKKKIRRFLTAVDSYILQETVSCETKTCLVSVIINSHKKSAKIEVIEF